MQVEPGEPFFLGVKLVDGTTRHNFEILQYIDVIKNFLQSRILRALLRNFWGFFKERLRMFTVRRKSELF